MELTIRIDNLMRSRRVHRSALPIPTNQGIPEPEPMQVGVTRLSAEERVRHNRLSQPESEMMKQYIEEELAKGFIVPSKSPASAGFFFVKKKDGSLRTCIDY